MPPARVVGMRCHAEMVLLAEQLACPETDAGHFRSQTRLDCLELRREASHRHLIGVSHRRSLCRRAGAIRSVSSATV